MLVHQLLLSWLAAWLPGAQAAMVAGQAGCVKTVPGDGGGEGGEGGGDGLGETAWPGQSWILSGSMPHDHALGERHGGRQMKGLSLHDNCSWSFPLNDAEEQRELSQPVSWLPLIYLDQRRDYLACSHYLRACGENDENRRNES